MISKNLFKVATIATLLSLGILSNGITPAQAAAMRNSKDIVNDMGIGWNLGNTLDATNSDLPAGSNTSLYETAWGNPVTSKAMIDEIKKAGFKTVRIPISWGAHIGSAPEYKVSDAWMNRVQDVVNYCVQNDLYVIVNVHHDSDWCYPTYSQENVATPRLKKLWTQIAERFKDYDDHLIFETLNEPRVIGSPEEWSGGTREGRDVVNHYNQAALDSIRATGGNNKDRSVMLPTYAAAATNDTLNDYKVPNDHNVIVSLHAYSPYWFAMATSGEYCTDKWGTNEDKKNLDSELDNFYNKFVAKGTPVVIGEFGSINKNNLSSRVNHARYFVSSALKRGMACVWWDNNIASNPKGNYDETFGIFNRSNLSWYAPEVKNALIAGYNDVKGTTNPGTTNPGTINPGSNDSQNLSGFTISDKKLNNWGSGYQMDLTLTNNTNTDIENWTLKIKKSDLPITVSWDADLSSDNEYTLLTPKSWKSKIPAGQSIKISFQGKEVKTTNFNYVLTK